MTRQEMIAVIAKEIERLEQIRELLAKSHSERFTFAQAASSSPGASRKRELSPEARRKIALAQKRRWAKQKRATPAAQEAL